MAMLCVDYVRVVNEGQVCALYGQVTDPYLIRIDDGFNDVTIYLSRRAVNSLHTQALYSDKVIDECSISRKTNVKGIKILDPMTNVWVGLSLEVLADMYSDLLTER